MKMEGKRREEKEGERLVRVQKRRQRENETLTRQFLYI